MKKNTIIILVLMFAMLGSSFAQSYKIVVNASNQVNSLSKKDISDLFLKKKTKWTSGTTVMPVDLNAGSKVRDDFSQNIHAKSTSAIRNFWQQAAFSGTASAPVEKNSDAEVIDYVKKNPGAIGYVSSGSGTEGVKIVSVN